MAAATIAPDRFWDLYFRNAFLTLERGPQGYSATMFEEPERAHAPEGLLRNMERTAVAITFSALQSYDYDADGRFLLITKRPADLNDAVQAIISQKYPYRDRPPFGKQHMSELFTQFRTMFGPPPTMAALEHATITLVDGFTEAQNHLIAALAWLLGERGERSSSQALLTIVQNAPFSPFAKHRLHFTPIDAAFTALWKVNDKKTLSPMLELLRITTDAGKRKIAPLFERLLSTGKLLSLEALEDNYFNADYWAHALRPYANYTPDDWTRYDVQSLFWEIRYQAVYRLPLSAMEMFRRLNSDEVKTVREAVRARLANK